MFVTINLWMWRVLVFRVIVFGMLGLITSGCPIMMIPMMGGMVGMNSGQHQEQKKESAANTADYGTAPKSHIAPLMTGEGQHKQDQQQGNVPSDREKQAPDPF